MKNAKNPYGDGKTAEKNMSDFNEGKFLVKSTFLAMTVLAAMTAPVFAQSAEKLPPPIMVDAKTEIQGRPGKPVKTPILWEKVRPQAVPTTYLAAPTATPATTSTQNGTVVISSQTTSTFDDNTAGASNAPACNLARRSRAIGGACACQQQHQQS